jgi:hypothetical protein
VVGSAALRAALMSVVVAGCGSSPATSPAPTCVPASPAPSPRAAAPPAVATADRARVDPGGTVSFDVTVTGPASVTVDCQQPLQVIVTDSTQLHIYTGQSPPAQAGHCGPLTLTAGHAESYAVSWPVDESLPGGAYSVVLLLGDAPQLTLSVAVGTVPHC